MTTPSNVRDSIGRDTTMPSLRTRDLTVGYRFRRARRTVLERVNVTAHAGELVCLLGSNGVGKSTLLRTLVRLQPPLGGAITLGGIDVTSMTQAELARRIGIVLTERITETLTARRLVELGRYAHSGWLGSLRERDRRAVDSAIDETGTRHFAERDFSRLSDGEQQRVMIARALAQEPMLLVLDEPTAFLDVSARLELWGLLRRLTTQRGLIVIVSTHDLELALRAADTVWLIVPGGELVSGRPEAVIESGAVEAAFATRTVGFLREQRAFRFVGDVSST